MCGKPNFEEMTRDELAHYMVAHRNTPEAQEACRVFIRQMAQRLAARGIDLYAERDRSQPLDSSSQSN
jgi:hypothetical protein